MLFSNTLRVRIKDKAGGDTVCFIYNKASAEIIL
jgi:hypothetical protein